MGPAYISPYSRRGDPQSRRRERQVASALRNSSNFVIVSSTNGAGDPARRACAEPRLRSVATVAAPDQPVQRPPWCPAKGSR